MRPGCTVAQRFAKSISTIRFIRVIETITPPSEPRFCYDPCLGELLVMLLPRKVKVE